MKTVLFLAAAGLSLSAGLAFAGEGSGNPDPFRAPGVTTTVTGGAGMANAPADPFPFRGQARVVGSTWSQRVLPPDGSQGAMQSANSLPRGFERGTVTYTEDRSVQRYMNRQAPGASSPVRHAQQQGVGPLNHG